ncbi:MAG: PEP-CTERM sorting domain-containing protein [Pirellulales bacterium]
MKRSLNLCVAILFGATLAMASSMAFAGIVLSDDFSSPDGPLEGTTPDISTGNWTETASAATPIQIASGAALVKSSGQDEFAAFTTSVPNVAGNGIKTSLDINVSAAQATGDYFSHLSNPAGTTFNFYQRLFARSATGGFQLGLVDTSGTGSTTTWGTTVLSLNAPYHVDVNWNFIAGGNNDAFTVSVDSLPYLAHTWTSVTAEPAQLAAGNLRQGSASNAPTLAVDNLVVSTIPIPEPTTLVASLIGLVSFAFRRRRV